MSVIFIKMMSHLIIEYHEIYTTSGFITAIMYIILIGIINNM